MKTPSASLQPLSARSRYRPGAAVIRPKTLYPAQPLSETQPLSAWRSRYRAAQPLSAGRSRFRPRRRFTRRSRFRGRSRFRPGAAAFGLAQPLSDGAVAFGEAQPLSAPTALYPAQPLSEAQPLSTQCVRVFLSG